MPEPGRPVREDEMESFDLRSMRRQPPPGDRRGEGNRPGGPIRRGPGTPGVGGRQFRRLTFWILFLLLVLFAVQYLFTPRTRESEITYSEFIKQMEDGNIASATFVQQEIRGQLKTKLPHDPAQNRPSEIDRFRVYLPSPDPELPKRIMEKNPGIAVRSKPAPTPWTSFLFSPLLGVGIVVFFWFLFLRQMQAGGSAALKFGKSRAKVLSENTVKVTFKDVAGADEAKEELQEIIEFLRDPKKFQVLGGRIPKGALLLGPPGTGKTLLAKAVAGEAAVPFFSMSGSDFVEMFVGVGASVTGDTPVLVRHDGRTVLTPIGEFIDRLYLNDEDGFVVPVRGLETLGMEELASKFKGSSKVFVSGSAWKQVKGVYRHRVEEICEIHYLGGLLRATADHSVFVRTRDGIKAVAACDLKPGDVLVDLPFKVRGAYSPEHGTPHTVRAHEFESAADPVYLEVVDRDGAAETRYAYALDQQDEMSQVAIAAAVGVSQMTISNWQRGRHLPRSLSHRYADIGLPERVQVTPDLMRLFGYYTAEGRENGNLEFTFGAHETDLHADCTTRMEHVFGVRPKVEHTLDNSTRLLYYSAPLGRFFARYCGNGSHSKHVPEFLWNLPKNYFTAYFEGYSRGDGYTTAEGKLSVTSVSHRLIRELTWLLAMHGVKAGTRCVRMAGGRVIKSKVLPPGEAWNLIIGKTSHPFGSGIVRRRQAKKPVVRKVVVKPFDGYVYDLCGCENEAFFGGEKPVLLHNSRVRDLFEQGKRNAPCIIFIDEIDAVGRHRGAGMGGGHDEREQTLNQLLVEMDGFESNEGVILLAATNRPDVLDPALLRPGRFDRQIVVDLPDVRGREGILKVHMKNKPIADDVDLRALARGTPGMAGADLANLVNEGALLAARRNQRKINMRDLEEAKDKVMMGPERKSLVLSDQEKRTTAYHESGHALVGWLLPEADPIHKVTVIPRGRALGVTHFLPEGDHYTRNREYFMATMATMMGGRSAEELIFGKITNGAASDIQTATALARKMVCEWGMSDRLGPLQFGKKQELIFLGREITEQKDYSERTAEIIDEEVHALVQGAYDRARGLLSQNIDRLHALAAALLEHEILDREEIDRILHGEGLGSPPPAPAETETAEKPAIATETPEARDPLLGQVPRPAPGTSAP